MKVAVVGAGQCGRMTAQRVAESDVFKTVALTDVIDGLAEGIALDINQSRAIVGFETTVVGRTTRNGDRGDESITEAEIVVVAAGVAPGPEWSLRRLIRENGLIIRRVSEAIARQAPDAVGRRKQHHQRPVRKPFPRQLNRLAERRLTDRRSGLAAFNVLRFGWDHDLQHGELGLLVGADKAGVHRFDRVADREPYGSVADRFALDVRRHEDVALVVEQQPDRIG